MTTVPNATPERLRHRTARRYPRWVSWPYAFTLGSALTLAAVLLFR